MVCFTDFAVDIVRGIDQQNIMWPGKGWYMDSCRWGGSVDVVRVAHIGLDFACGRDCILGDDTASDTRFREKKKVVKKRNLCLTFRLLSDNICKRSGEGQKT